MHECPHAYIPSHPPTPSHLPRASVKYQSSFCSTNDLFTKQELLFSFKKLVTHWKNLQCTFDLVKLRVFMYLWATNFFFGFSPPDAARRSNIFTNLHYQDSCLTVNKIWVFHPGGDLPHLAMPKNTYIFFSISFKTV